MVTIKFKDNYGRFRQGQVVKMQPHFANVIILMGKAEIHDDKRQKQVDQPAPVQTDDKKDDGMQGKTQTTTTSDDETKRNRAGKNGSADSKKTGRVPTDQRYSTRDMKAEGR